MALILSPALLTAAHTAVKNLIDAGSGPGYMSIHNSGGTVLAVLPFTDPCGTVNSGTGQLTIVFGPRDDAAAATGTAALAKVFDSAGTLLIDAIPCVAGSAAQANTCVLTTTSIVLGAPVEGISFTIG